MGTCGLRADDAGTGRDTHGSGRGLFVGSLAWPEAKKGHVMERGKVYPEGTIVELKVSTSSKKMGWEEQEINISFDFSGCYESEVLYWAAANRRIAWQRPVKNLSLREYMELDGRNIPARSAGGKIESKDEAEMRQLFAMVMKKREDMTIEELAELISEM